MTISVDAARFKLTVAIRRRSPIRRHRDALHRSFRPGMGRRGVLRRRNNRKRLRSRHLGKRGRLKLGLVQFARGVTWQAFYAGRTPKEGSIILDFFLPPAMTSTLLLDAANERTPEPFYRSPVNIFRSGTASSDWGDRPGMVVFKTLNNRVVSNVPNYLFHAIMDREFVTILTAVSENGAPQYVAFFEWQVRYDFKLKWEGEKLKVALNSSTCSITTPPTAGKPSAAHWQGLLAAPTGERANAVGRHTELQTNNLGPPNRRDLETRFANVHPDFWT